MLYFFPFLFVPMNIYENKIIFLGSFCGFIRYSEKDKTVTKEYKHMKVSRYFITFFTL